MNIFLFAGGKGLELNDVIKNKIPSEVLKPFAKGLELDEEGYSLWGLSEFGALKPESLKEDDIIFISNQKCLVYIAKIFFCFEDDEIDDIAWFGQKRWKYKVVLKDPIKIFIPDENDENIDELIKIHGKNEHNLNEVKSWHNKKIGLRYVLSKKDKGYLQGNYQIGTDTDDRYNRSDEIIEQFNWYCNVTKYQCIEMYV